MVVSDSDNRAPIVVVVRVAERGEEKKEIEEREGRRKKWGRGLV